MNENKILALQLMATKSENALHDALKTIRAFNRNSPVAQQRYNCTAGIALNDPQAEFTDEEKNAIIAEIGSENSQFGRPTIYADKMKQVAIYLPDEMIYWLNTQNRPMGETIRMLINTAMANE